MEGHGPAEGQAVALVPRGLAADPPTQLGQQARLAHARLRHQECHLALAVAGTPESIEQQAQLPLPAHERREPDLGRDLQPRAGLARGHHLPRADGLGLALDLHLAEGPRLEVAAHEAVGRLRDRHAAGRSALLHARGDVTGMKTGYTRASGFNLVVTATHGGQKVISVVLGGRTSGQRYQAAAALLGTQYRLPPSQSSAVSSKDDDDDDEGERSAAAATSPATTFGDCPEVVNATTTSPGRASASTCRANTSSYE